MKKPKRPSREERFLELFGEQLAKHQAATEGLTPQQLAERDQLLLERAASRRAALWTRWLHAAGWTARQAGFLLAGYEPKERLVGTARHGGAERRAIGALTERLTTRVKEHLKPLTRRPGAMPRYAPRDVIRVALSSPELGYAKDLDSLVQNIAALRRPRRQEPFRPKSSVVFERAQLVVEVARELVAEGRGYEHRGEPHLHMNSLVFYREIRQRRKDAHRLLPRFDRKMLLRARMDRKAGNPLPRVFLAEGRPRISDT